MKKSLKTSFEEEEYEVPNAGRSVRYILPDADQDDGEQSQDASQNEIDRHSHRTAMGEYIVPSGGKPLTSLGDHRPGPSDYTPKIDLTKPTAPQYSIVGKQKRHKEVKRDCPGPADYDTAGNLIWRDKHASLKGRGKSFFEEEGKRATVGPNKYNVENLGVGKCGPKFNMSFKQPGDIYNGPPNSLIAPVDTHGFDSPAPCYRPNSSQGNGPKSSFGIKFKSRSLIDAEEGPGPADYTLEELPASGPAYSFGYRLPPPNEQGAEIGKLNPAANTYDIGTTIGKAVKVSITGRRPEPQSYTMKLGPSPNAYTLKDAFDKRKGITLAYKHFDQEEPNAPGPADYSIKPVDLEKSPAYSCGQRTNPCYPTCVINYATKSQQSMPGPGNYDLVREFARNDKPSFSMGRKGKEVKKAEPVPAPNAYNSHEKDKPAAKRPPAYSIGKRLDKSAVTHSPGPAAYFPMAQASGPKFSMTKRQKARKSFKNPAPNAYTLRLSQTVHGSRTSTGIKLKSRASPYVFSGFSNKIVEPVSS